MENKESRLALLRRTAKEVRDYKVKVAVMRTVVIMMVIIIAVMYIFAALYKKTGSFTISLDKVNMTKYGLTLSESRFMTYKTSHLNAKISEDITNIAGETLPANIDEIDGVHNGRNYIAYTFYLQNGGDYTVSYEYSVDISNISNQLDEAIRVRLYIDGVPTTYAKTRSDGGGAEVGTTEFYSSTMVTVGRIDDFEPGDITKYTVVVWIEGNDPDCTDPKIGGTVKIEMDMSIIH